MAVPLDHDAGERGSDLGIRQVVLGGLQRPPGLLDGLLLDLDQQLDLTDLVVADFREVDALGRLLFRLLRGLQRPPGDVDLGPGGQGLGEPGRGEVDLRGGRVAGLRHLLLLPQWAGPLLLEPGEACVLQLGQRQRGLRRLHSGAGLVDPLLDFVTGIFQGFLGPGPVSHCGGGRVRRAISIWIGTSLRTRVQVGTLAGQLGPGRSRAGPATR